MRPNIWIDRQIKDYVACDSYLGTLHVLSIKSMLYRFYFSDDSNVHHSFLNQLCATFYSLGQLKDLWHAILIWGVYMCYLLNQCFIHFTSVMIQMFIIPF